MRLAGSKVGVYFRVAGILEFGVGGFVGWGSEGCGFRQWNI